MDKEFLKQVLAVPTCTGSEGMMIEFVENWCKENGVPCRKDGKGNLMLTKGSTSSYFPCITAHLDTVQDVKKFVDAGQLLTIEEQGDKLTCKEAGTGSDCKAGVAICLSLVKSIPSIKCALFVEEETGCKGSNAFDMSFFDDCGYVIGFDSPTWNRAAKSCSGVMLFDNDFFEEYVKDVAKKHGVDNFRHEPYTDVKVIRQKTELACMNFSNGGYAPHSKTEWQSYSDACKGEALGEALINRLGDKQYKIPYDKAQQDKRSEEQSSFSSSFDIWDMLNKRVASYSRPESHYRSDDLCEIPMEFKSRKAMEVFVKRLNNTGRKFDIDIDDEDPVVYVDGKLEDVQEAYVMAINQIENADFLDFDDLNPAIENEFWDTVIFMKDLDDYTPEDV